MSHALAHRINIVAILDDTETILMQMNNLDKPIENLDTHAVNGFFCMLWMINWQLKLRM